MTRSQRWIPGVMALLGAMVLSAQSAAAQTMGDAQILGRLLAANQGEAQLAQYVAQTTQNAAVRAYANMLARDHTAGAQQVQSTATQAGITPDMSAGSDLTSHGQQEMQTLQSQSGAAMDQAFAGQMVQDHQTMITEVQNAHSQAQNPAVHTLLQGTTPVLQRHLAAAQRLQRQLGGGNMGGMQHPMPVHKDTGR